MRLLLYFLFITFQTTIFCQDLVSLRHSRTDTFKADFYILSAEKKIKFIDTLDYYWFKSQQVHSTQGCASGNLLQGKYTCYYLSGQLAEQGNFISGLKSGEWKSWFESGQLKSIFNFESGVLHGNFFEYNETGRLVKSGNYKNGLLHGEIVINGDIIEYKNGTPYTKKSDTEPEGDQNEIEPEEKAGLLSFLKRKKTGSKREERKKNPKDNSDKPKFSEENNTKPTKRGQ
ncbi:MAG: hypothetical protein JNJ99_01825 [Crocinitomicaceae bacterium]|nr:hypothetical protein [Crocinitomicaceae bacterium]